MTDEVVVDRCEDKDGRYKVHDTVHQVRSSDVQIMRIYLQHADCL